MSLVLVGTSEGLTWETTWTLMNLVLVETSESTASETVETLMSLVLVGTLEGAASETFGTSGEHKIDMLWRSHTCCSEVL